MSLADLATNLPEPGKADQPSAEDHDDDGPSVPSIQDLLERSSFILEEIDVFRKHYKAQNEVNLEISAFRGDIQSEQKPLRALLRSDTNAQKTHILRSSNLPFYEHAWRTAKQSHSVIAFSKRFHWSTATPGVRPRPTRRSRRATANTPTSGSAFVDVVADDGATWIKVSTLSEKRLLFDIAKQGWEIYDSDSEGSTSSSADSLEQDHTSPGATAEPESNDIPIVQTARELSRAAAATRIRYVRPAVRLVLPNVREGHEPAIDAVLAEIRALGIVVSTQAEQCVAPPIAAALATMQLDFSRGLTPTLNIDCTILLAVVSDLSHRQVADQPYFHKATRRQIERERGDPMLPRVLYPALGGRELVCTREAVGRMREIVQLIGTDSEKARARVFLGEQREGESLEVLSDYEVPRDLRLPVRVVEYTEEHRERLPARMAGVVMPALSALNESVFMFGWATGHATVTSNGTVVKRLEGLIEANRAPDEDELVGPVVWLCDKSRSLVGKDKGRKE